MSKITKRPRFFVTYRQYTQSAERKVQLGKITATLNLRLLMSPNSGGI